MKNQDNDAIVRVDSSLQDLIPGYLANRRKDIQRILDALDQGDYRTVDTLGHSMKGSGGGYGFDFITEIGRVFELAGKEQSGGRIRQAVAELADYLDRIKIVYE